MDFRSEISFTRILCEFVSIKYIQIKVGLVNKSFRRISVFLKFKTNFLSFKSFFYDRAACHFNAILIVMNFDVQTLK